MFNTNEDKDILNYKIENKIDNTVIKQEDSCQEGILIKFNDQELVGNKRYRRRLRREAEFGPEVLVIKDDNGNDILACGHNISFVFTRAHRGKQTFTRCIVCKEK